MSHVRNTSKLKTLLAHDLRIFRTHDLAVLWDIPKRATLQKTISRYIDRDILHPIYRGLYSTVPLDKLNSYELGCAVSGPYSYVSAETVLENNGAIMQKANKITLFGKKSKEIEIGNRIFLCRYLNSKYLLNRAGIKDKTRFSIASAARALADMRHINPDFFCDNEEVVNKNALNKLVKEIGYK